MNRATISQIKNSLSAYLKKVRAGQTILILDRDEPIARLEPVGDAGLPEDRLTRLQRAGLLRRSTRKLPPDILEKTPPRARKSVVEALLAERAESR